MKYSVYSVSIGQRTTRCVVTPKEIERRAHEFTFDALKNPRRAGELIALERGVKKLYGRHATWIPDNGLPGFGQVMRWDDKLHAYNAITYRVRLDVEAV